MSNFFSYWFDGWLNRPKAEILPAAPIFPKAPENLDPHLLDGNGFSQLHHALKQKEISKVKKLLELGADPNLPTKNGLTPLILASMYGSLETITDLLNYGACPNQKGKLGLTALHSMVMHDFFNSAETLIKYGANIGLQDELGNTPLHYARTPGMINCLIRHGASVYIKNHQGQTPLEFILTNRPHTVYGYHSKENYPCDLFSSDLFTLGEENWKNTNVIIREENGEFKECSLRYERNTTDLYLIESDLNLRKKALFVIGYTPLHLLKESCFKIIRLVEVFIQKNWQIFTQFPENSLANSLKQACLFFTYEFPKEIVTQITKLALLPIFCLSILFGSMYCLYAPLEGQKLLNQMETIWNEKGILTVAQLEKLGNLSTSQLNGYARFKIKVAD